MDDRIIIWKTPTCTRCPGVIRQLQQHELKEGEDFRVEDLTTPENAENLRYFTEDLSIKQVPIVEYKNHLAIGGMYGEVMGFIKQYKTEHAR